MRLSTVLANFYGYFCVYIYRHKSMYAVNEIFVGDVITSKYQ